MLSPAHQTNTCGLLYVEAAHTRRHADVSTERDCLSTLTLCKYYLDVFECSPQHKVLLFIYYAFDLSVYYGSWCCIHFGMHLLWTVWGVSVLRCIFLFLCETSCWKSDFLWIDTWTCFMYSNKLRVLSACKLSLGEASMHFLVEKVEYRVIYISNVDRQNLFFMR